MNEFYTMIIHEACANCGIPFPSGSTINAIIDRSLAGLTENERLFITTFYPPWSMENRKIERTAFHHASSLFCISRATTAKLRKDIREKLLSLITKNLQALDKD